jgi:uncharacterized Zn-binding protein involved in type VI secretion
MAAVARVGDTTMGTCPLDHSGATGVQVYTGPGVIISGSGSTFADGNSVARIGDQVLPGCGHVSTIVSGSGVSFADGIGIARIGDAVAGPYVATIVSGSGSTFTA